jgi:hypothetical protein
MLGTICTFALLLIFGAYAIPHLFVSFFYKTKNLKKAYNADWALVTGGSSGESPGPQQGPAATSCRQLYVAGRGARSAFLVIPSAGIGKSIARKLAGQGLNVVLVALGDALLDATHKELSEQYPRVTIRKVRRRAAWPV